MESENPKIAMISLWRNDELKKLWPRAEHLTSKTYPNMRWIWVVGDSDDNTEGILKGFAASLRPKRDIRIYAHRTGHAERLLRLRDSGNLALSRILPSDDYVVIHESDLISPPDLIERFLATGKCPIAGWPVLNKPMQPTMFYDIWAYRKDGVRFANKEPYHKCYQARDLFEVDSVGSCWMFYAEDVRSGVRMNDMVTVNLCEQFRAMGRHIWVDPTIIIEQPFELWKPMSIKP